MAGRWWSPAATTARCGCGTWHPGRRRAVHWPRRPGERGGGRGAGWPAGGGLRRRRRLGAGVGPGIRDAGGGPFTGHTGLVNAVAVGELDGRPVAVSGGADGTVRVSDLASGTPAGDPLTGHAGWVRAVAVGELDGRPVVVSGGDDGTVRVWDLARRRAARHLLRPIRLDHAAPVLAAVVAPRKGHTTVVTGCSDSTTRTWDLASRRSLSRIAIPGGSGISAIALLAPDRVLYANRGRLCLYAATRDAAPVLTIELESEVLALAGYRTSIVAATRFGLVALDIPQ